MTPADGRLGFWKGASIFCLTLSVALFGLAWIIGHTSDAQYNASEKLMERTRTAEQDATRKRLFELLTERWENSKARKELHKERAGARPGERDYYDRRIRSIDQDQQRIAEEIEELGGWQDWMRDDPVPPENQRASYKARRAAQKQERTAGMLNWIALGLLAVGGGSMVLSKRRDNSRLKA